MASMEKCSSNEVIIVKVSSNSSSILLICAYCRPSSPSISSTTKSYLLAYEGDLKRAIICLDANAKSPAWNSLALDKKGKELENLLSRFHLKVANAKLGFTKFHPGRYSFRRRYGSWTRLRAESLALSTRPLPIRPPVYIFRPCHYPAIPH